MTTTLHGLVTISELFAGFNLINTGVLNCLIMCQNARKMHHYEAKNQKKLWGGGHPLPKLHPLEPRRLEPSALDLGPPNESPGSASGESHGRICLSPYQMSMTKALLIHPDTIYHGH